MTDTFNFDVTNSFSGDVQFTGKLPVSLKTAPQPVQLGAAVRWGVENKADFEEAHLRGAYLARANLRGANFAGANFEGAYLESANLARTNLTEANFKGANFEGARLEGAHLKCTNFEGANLKYANLEGATFARAHLAGAKIGKHTLTRLISTIWRTQDPYEFFAFETEKGDILIRAVCRTMLIAAYREHVQAAYPDTIKARETIDILDFFEKRHAAMRVVEG